MAQLFIPAPSPSCRSKTFTAQPCFCPYMVYMRCSISAQSWLSVPPAPLFISKIAVILSSGLFSELLNSVSSIVFFANSKAVITSFSEASLAFQNSKSMAKSSTLFWVVLNKLHQYSNALVSFKILVARSLLSQKPMAISNCLFWVILCCLVSTSKKPP